MTRTDKSQPCTKPLRYNNSMDNAPLFSVDIMLGKLARWLRLMGFDTFYSNVAEDEFLMELSLRERRILLTRDRPLIARMAEKAYFVRNIFLREQLQEVVDEFHLSRFQLPRRCSVCNGTLARMPKPLVQHSVPPYVFRTQEHFYQCQKCGKLYWEGTHIRHIQKIISETIHPTDNNTTISPERVDE